MATLPSHELAKAWGCCLTFIWPAGPCHCSIAMIGQDEHGSLITEYLLLSLNSLSRKTLVLVRPNIGHRQTARPGDPPIGNIGGIGSCFWQMRRRAPSVPQKPCRCLFHISAVIPDSYLTFSVSIVAESTSRSATCSDIAC